jgi:hypothetical protein
MNATLVDLPNETRETLVSCANCPAVQRLERALKQLQRDFRREVGYWKTQHAKAVRRIEQLTEELEQSRGQVRVLQDKLFGRKSEKSAQGNRSNDLFDPENVAAVDATIPTCRSRKSSSRCRKNRCSVRFAEGWPRQCRIRKIRRCWRSTCGPIDGGFDGDAIEPCAIAISRDER